MGIMSMGTELKVLKNETTTVFFLRKNFVSLLHDKTHK